jgi:hypothetical protein
MPDTSDKITLDRVDGSRITFLKQSDVWSAVASFCLIDGRLHELWIEHYTGAKRWEPVRSFATMEEANRNA